MFIYYKIFSKFVNQNFLEIKNKTAKNLVNSELYYIFLNFSSLIKFLVNISSRIYKI